MPRLGILGTLVWDSIHHPGGEGEPVRDWGGIAYSLAAFDAAAPEGWEAVPIIKVGADLRSAADAFLDSLSRVGTREFVCPVPEPNNRVELFYHDASRRCERLVGGVPGWKWEELEPAVDACDALYVNFIAGWEMDLEAATGLGREPRRRPTYCDVHSLVLAVTGDGVREPRPLPDRDAWLAAFDLVQVNEDELVTLAGDAADRAARAAELLRAGPDVLFVTLGSGGAAWWARPRTRWRRGASDSRHGSSALDGGDGRDSGGDPTGCGDVWGVVCFSSLLDGAALPEAVHRANRFAARCAASSGTEGLVRRLAGAGSPAVTGG